MFILKSRCVNVKFTHRIKPVLSSSNNIITEIKNAFNKILNHF